MEIRLAHPPRLLLKPSIVCAVFIVCSCTLKTNSEHTPDTDFSRLEAVVTSVDGALDSLSPNAYMGDCPLAFEQSCERSTQILHFNGCQPLQGHHYFGQVRLAYEDGNCALDINEQVLRTHSLSIEDSHGGELKTEGGIKLTRREVSRWELVIEGVKKSLNNRGKQLTSVSVQSNQPVEITGSLERSLRVLNGGVVAALDNNNKNTSAYRFKDLRYVANCCHPVRGIVEILNSDGTRARAEFKGCGEGTFVSRQKKTPFLLTYCE
jgi:hypothetical protein